MLVLALRSLLVHARPGSSGRQDRVGAARPVSVDGAWPHPADPAGLPVQGWPDCRHGSGHDAMSDQIGLKPDQGDALAAGCERAQQPGMLSQQRLAVAADPGGLHASDCPHSPHQPVHRRRAHRKGGAACRANRCLPLPIPAADADPGPSCCLRPDSGRASKPVSMRTRSAPSGLRLGHASSDGGQVSWDDASPRRRWLAQALGLVSRRTRIGSGPPS
jgi:hypothetical protein